MLDLLLRFNEGFRTRRTGALEMYACEIEIAAERRTSIYLPPPNAVEFDIPNTDLYLTFAMGMMPDAWDKPRAGPCRFEVAVDDVQVWGREIDPVHRPEDRRWHEVGICLPRQTGGDLGAKSAPADRVLRLQSVAIGEPDFRWALWATPRAWRLGTESTSAPTADLPGSDLKPGSDVELQSCLRARHLHRLATLTNDKLNLGCGSFPLPDWTNIDGGDGQFFSAPAHPEVVQLDVFEALRALPGGSVKYITSEQFFEHFTRQEGYALMSECRRVLRPGGIMRMQVPDLEAVVRLYRNEIPEADWARVQLPHRLMHIAGTRDPYGRLLPGEQYTPAMMINNGFHMDGHRFLYDYATLEQTLRLAGFSKCERATFNWSRHDALRGIDHHDGGPTGRAWVPKVALIVEATA